MTLSEFSYAVFLLLSNLNPVSLGFFKNAYTGFLSAN
jgi:hypothetical protein